MNRLLLWLSRNMPLRTIALDSGPYLERYFVGQWFGVTVYLHRFLSADTERHLHNHPWGWGRSAVLSGAYDEESVVDICPHMPGGAVTVSRRVRWFNRVDGNHFHRISNAAPNTWTLFIHGPRQWVQRPDGVYVRKGWGFLENCTFVEYPSAADDWWLRAPRRGA
jgi:hypothetical protein